ncbi:hypothetical protein G9C98_008228 [Cotesia typhae]|uniref:U2A'/phosphoprotein 32 family A C-terminal domain-containing protein n=1 Tax=Cotesia typhae TaxID=2053667 RepID=A0A8J5UVR0_9HYME|nr:hypothetical protein G9C98_008228 [Cotesia typhae]
MVRLTEEMVVARSRISDLTAVKKLYCWGSELTDVSILRELKKVEILSLSINKINSLADFQYCSNLKDLFIRRNNITDLNEICYLQNLPNLRNLWFEENPCAEREGYRMAVIRALPNLEKLDDKFVTADEINVALSRGKILIHPLNMDASPPQSDPASPELFLLLIFCVTNAYNQEVAEFIDEVELERNRRYSSSSDQRSYDDPHQGHEEYQDTDRRNANYSASSPHQYSQNNHYNYDLQNGQTKNQIKDEAAKSVESRTNGHSLPTNIAEVSKDYDDRPAVVRQNGDYEDRRGYSTEYERSSEPNTHRSQQEDSREMPGWVRHSEKEKCRFHYHKRPVTRNSNILSAVLCLVKELDYPSLEVVEMAVRNRMDELEE